MTKNDQKRPSNEEIIKTYLDHYRHSKSSVKMRNSSLNYFFGEEDKRCFGYNGHIFDIDTSVLIDYFEWLKNLDLVSIQTRRNKWTILSSLLQYTMEYYNARRKGNVKKLKRKGVKTPENEVWEKFIVIIPSRTIDWKGAIPKKKPIDSNADVYATKEEVEEILQYFKRHSFKLYLIFRTIADTGMRKGELINAKISELKLEERHFHTKEGKTGEKIYPFQKDLAKKLEIYLNGRKKENVKTDILFLNKHLRQYNNKDFNTFLREARNALKINKRITTKTFRKTLNDYRKEMGCNLEDREMLIGHKTMKVNIQNYTRSDVKRHIRTYDNWYPYKNLNI